MTPEERRAYDRERGRKYRATERGRNAARARIRRHQQRKAERVQAIREASPCADCGISYPYYVMDFDHVRGEKLGDVAALVRRASWERVEAEIAKCELVCANCHRIRTHAPASKP